MSDLTETIIPKSDQQNADDFLAGPKTVKITSVKLVKGDQPVHIYFDGDSGKPYKPCKSMRRALISVWGSDGENYVGKSLTLFCEPSVKWAGKEVGGIRISHMSDIKEPIKIILTVTRGMRKPYMINKLVPKVEKVLTDKEYSEWVEKMDKATDMVELNTVGAEINKSGYDEAGKAKIGDYFRKVMKEFKDK